MNAHADAILKNGKLDPSLDVVAEFVQHDPTGALAAFQALYPENMDVALLDQACTAQKVSLGNGRFVFDNLHQLLFSNPQRDKFALLFHDYRQSNTPFLVETFDDPLQVINWSPMAASIAPGVLYKALSRTKHKDFDTALDTAVAAVGAVPPVRAARERAKLADGHTQTVPAPVVAPPGGGIQAEALADDLLRLQAENPDAPWLVAPKPATKTQG